MKNPTPTEHAFDLYALALEIAEEERIEMSAALSRARRMAQDLKAYMVTWDRRLRRSRLRQPRRHKELGMTPVERLAALPSPAEWAGLASAHRAIYLAHCTPLALGLLAERLAAFEGCTVAALLGEWVIHAYITTAEAFAARGAIRGA